MTITFDVDLLKKEGLTFDEYAWLLSRYDGKTYGISVKVDLSKLEKEKFVKVMQDSIALRERAYKLFDSGDATPLKDWVEQWRDLFPKGVRTGNYPVRGDARSCLANMQRFFKHYPQYNRELVINATKVYVDRSRKDGWKYMTCAHYFIIKDGFANGVSKLAAECEAYLERGESAEGEGDGRITTQL